MATKKNNKQVLRFDAKLTCGEVARIAADICNERTEQMAVELVNKYIALNHADHISQNEAVYNTLLDVVKRRLAVGSEKANSIYVSVINADYDIRHGFGNGYYIR
jgi:hypothetical protein